MATLGLIPAKGGSTRLLRKNIIELGGKPLIQWSIDVAHESGVIDSLVVSTEDDEIASIANSLGAEVPFIRPKELARDPAGVVDVALHALSALNKDGKAFDKLIILLPTCPFRTANDIRNALTLFEDRNGKYLMSVSQYGHTPFAALDLKESYLTPFFTTYIGKKSQEMPAAYRANGAIHVLDVCSFKKTKSYYSSPLLGYVMPHSRSIDIDTEEDLNFAQFILKEGLIEQE